MSYLTPDWLMQDIGQLLRPMSEEAFKEEGIGEQKSKTTRYYVDAEGNRVTEDAKGHPISATGWGWYEEETSPGGGTTLRYGMIPGLEQKYSTSSWAEYEGEQYGTMGEAYGAYKSQLPGAGETIFDPASFVGGIETAQGMDVGTEDPEAFTAFTPEMFKKLRTEYYQPELEEKRGSLIDQLIGKQRKARAIGGGFAGYGGREAASQAVETGYRGGVEDIYAGIEQKKAAGLQSIYDVLSQYEAIGEPA